jgi:hypothetical protein
MAPQTGREAAKPDCVRFRGCPVSREQICQIREVLRQHPKALRRHIALRVCRRWNWKRPNGELNVRACLDLLARLQKLGQIKLREGKPRRARRRAGAPQPKYWTTVPAILGPTEVDLRRVVVRPIRDREEIARWREAMELFHYLGDGELVGESLRYVAEDGRGWLALLGWGAAALKCRHREAFLAWPEELRLQRLGFLVNNARFLILPWVRVPHLASHVLAANLRRLCRDWESAYAHRVLVAETFVDLNRFRGTCYRACNWKYLGQTRGMGRRGSGYVEHGVPKGLFVYLLHSRAREILSSAFPSPEILETPAMTTRFSIDVNRLPLEGRGGLLEALGEILDPRKRRGIRHPFRSVLALSVMAALCGMRTYEAMAEWAKDLPKEILKRLRCWCHQAPSEPTFRRVLQSVDAEEVDLKVSDWLSRQEIYRKAKAIALDGKTLRGSGDGDEKPWHLLSAVTHGDAVVVAQESVGEKTNEITHAKPLLGNLDLEGKVVTADAMHTQTDFARFVVEEKKADYVLIAKENQPTLQGDIKLLHAEDFSPSGQLDRQGPWTCREPQDLPLEQTEGLS